MSRTRRSWGWGWGLAVMGWFVGCGTQPVATREPARQAPAAEPVPLPSSGPTSEDLARPVDPAPPPPTAPRDEPAPEPSPGLLCGPASRPCTVEIEETLPDSISKAWEQGAATLLLDGQQRPHLFAAYPSSGGAILVRSHEGTWSVQKLPSNWFNPIFTLRGDEPLVARGDPEGNAPLTIWKQVEGDWRLEADLGLPLRPWEGLAALQTDDQGQLHALLRTKQEPFRFVYVAEAEGWTPHVSDSTPDNALMLNAGFILSPRGEAQRAYWKRAPAANTWTLFWQSGIAPPEQVLSLTPSLFGDIPRALALGWTRDARPGGLETRHLFFTRPQQGAMDFTEIVYAAKTGEGAWTVRPLFPTELRTPRCRTTPPRSPGDDCVEEFITHGPRPVVTSGSQLRFFSRSMHTFLEWYPHCPGGDDRACAWHEDGRTYLQGMKMFWVEGDQSGTVDLPQVPENFDVLAAQADPQGRLHLLLRRGAYPEQWRYLRLGAGPSLFFTGAGAAGAR